MVENIQLSSPYQHSINSQMHYIYTKQNPFMHVSFSMKPRRHCNFIDHLMEAALKKVSSGDLAGGSDESILGTRRGKWAGWGQNK